MRVFLLLLAPFLALTVACASPYGAAADNGYLEGRVTIGPLRPVEKADEPPPTPSPEVCTARSLTILKEDGKTEVTTVDVQPDCTYRVSLAPGKYVVQTKQGLGNRGRNLPQTVEIESGKTTRLDVDIDTGIR